MIDLQVNGEAKRLESDCSVADALTAWGYRLEDIAIAVNSEFVPRHQYPQQILAENDLVDIVTAIQGG